MKVAVVISYYSPDYIRGKSMIAALELLPEVQLHVVRNRSRGLLRYLESFIGLLKLRIEQDPDIYVLPFRGHEIFPLVWLLSRGRRIIFDEMLSPYDSLVNEVKQGILGRLIAVVLRFFERIILQRSDVVLTDTNIHAEYISNLLDIPRSKLVVLPVSNVPIIGKSWQGVDLKKDYLDVFFYGTFQKLHGVDVILDAAELCNGLPIKFTIVGGKGRKSDPILQRIQGYKCDNLEHFLWMEYEELLDRACRADICLGGPFHGRGQATRVITGKTYQFMSLGIPMVIGRIQEDTGFVDKENCLLVEQGSAEELVDSITWAYENKTELDRIGLGGKQLFNRRYCIPRLAKTIKELIFKYQNNV